MTNAPTTSGIRNPTEDPVTSAPTTSPSPGPTEDPVTSAPTTSPVPTVAPTTGVPTSFPTLDHWKSCNYSLTLDANFDAFDNYTNSNGTLQKKLALSVVASGLGVDTDSSNIEITILDVYEGSIIIDYTLSANNELLIETALSNMNDSVGSSGMIGNVAFEFMSNVAADITTPSPTADMDTTDTTDVIVDDSDNDGTGDASTSDDSFFGSTTGIVVIIAVVMLLVILLVVAIVCLVRNKKSGVVPSYQQTVSKTHTTATTDGAPKGPPSFIPLYTTSNTNPAFHNGHSDGLPAFQNSLSPHLSAISERSAASNMSNGSSVSPRSTHQLKHDHDADVVIFED